MPGVSGASRRPLRRAEQQAQTRRRVRDAADAVFAERGFHAARLEDIAVRAGYTRGAVYSNFKNKDELALAIIQERIETVTSVLEELAAADAAAEAVGARISQLFVGERPWAPLFLEFVTHAVRHPDLAARITALYRELASTITKLLERFASQSGIELWKPPERVALIMLAAADGAAVERLIDPERADATLLGEMLGLITTGIATHPDKGR
jgi:AcrR family transcriptional regulator